MDVVLEGEGVFEVGWLRCSYWLEHVVDPFSKAMW